MRQRGSSVIEVLVAATIGVVVALGFASFFLAMLRFGKGVEAQAALQRQGNAIAEELGRRLRLADGSPEVEDPANPPAIPACLPLSTNDTVLVIASPSGSVVCLYRDTSSPPQIVRCTRPTPTDDCAPVANLLSGSLVPLSATCAPASTCTPWSASLVTPCGAADGTCDESGVCSVAGQSCSAVPGARVVFTLSDGVNRPETFGVTSVATRH
jgi:Tfp pilus assembly protein PilW